MGFEPCVFVWEKIPRGNMKTKEIDSLQLTKNYKTATDEVRYVGMDVRDVEILNTN